MSDQTYDEMLSALKAAGVLVWHGCTTGDRLLPYPHPMPPGGVDLWRITDDPELLAQVPQPKVLAYCETGPPADAVPGEHYSVVIAGLPVSVGARVVVTEDTERCLCGPRNDDPTDPDPGCPQHGHLTRPVTEDTETGHA